jgi:3-methyl-2-oxobutanoate hydroxymethyltransferase
MTQATTTPAAAPAAAAAPVKRKKMTIPMLMEKKKKKEPIVQLAVYDYENAIVADRLGIDILCVSDTGGMVLFGHETTTSVSFEEVMFMAQAVKRGSKYGLRMVDMPYMSFHLSEQQAVDNAAQYVAKAGAGPHRHLPDAYAATGWIRRAGQDGGTRQGTGG